MASAVTSEIKKNVIQYIYASRSFNAVDISLLMYIMFKDKYKVDIDDQWYENIEGLWNKTDSFTIRNEITTSVSRMVADCIQFIKENRHMTFDNTNYTRPTYETVVADLVKKRQILRNMNKIDQALVVTHRINQIIESPELINNRLTDDQLNLVTIISKMQTKVFKDAVMANLINIFYI
jgi:hypothetical protein